MNTLSGQSCRGAGIGLRPAHLRQVHRDRPTTGWFEVHICNYLGGGINRALLNEIGQHYALSFHGVNLNLGGVDPLDRDYLNRLAGAVRELSPALISEHASFCSHNQHFFHDLMPVPYTEEAVDNMARRIRQVQDTLGRRILIENVSRYFSYPQSTLSEAQFLAAVCAQADCGLLLDLNNAYVNQHNLGLDVHQFLQELPLERVEEVHLAGFTGQADGLLIDTHASAPCEEVWELFAACCELLPGVPCLIEWDADLPPLPELLALAQRAQATMDEIQTRQSTLRSVG